MTKISTEIESKLKQVCNSYIQTFQIHPNTQVFEEFKSRLGTSMFAQDSSGNTVVQISGPARMVESDMDCRYNWYTIDTWSTDNLVARYSFPLALSWHRTTTSDEILMASKDKPGYFRFNLKEAELKYASRKLDQHPGGYKSTLVFDAEEDLLTRSRSVLLSIFPEAVKMELSLPELLTHDLVHRT